jgi:hypothetical protein
VHTNGLEWASAGTEALVGTFPVALLQRLRQTAGADRPADESEPGLSLCPCDRMVGTGLPVREVPIFRLMSLPAAAMTPVPRRPSLVELPGLSLGVEVTHCRRCATTICHKRRNDDASYHEPSARGGGR